MARDIDKGGIRIRETKAQIAGDVKHLSRLQAEFWKAQETLMRAKRTYLESLELLRRLEDTEL